MVNRRGMFKRWSASLVVVSFLLCILGTYLTRSGILDSVHSFPKSSIGWFFLVFMIISAVGAVVAIVSRLQLLRSEHDLVDLISREGAFLAVNVLLVLMMVITLVGTLFPVFSNLFTSQRITPERSFYNMTVLPLALALAAVMAVGPLLTFGSGAAARAARLLKMMMAVAGLAAVGAFLLAANVPLLGSLLAHPHFTVEYFGKVLFAGQAWTVAVAAVLAGVLAGITLDFSTAVATRRRAITENFLLAPLNVLLADRRRWGAQTVHFGIAAIILGIAGSSLHNIDKTQSLTVDQSARVGKYTITFAGLSDAKRPNHGAVIATVLVTDLDGNKVTLHPERRFYPKSEEGQSSSEVAINFSLSNDIYVNLAGWEDDGKTATLQIIINPLINWIWIGGGILALGATLCLIPRGAPAPATVSVPAAPATTRRKNKLTVRTA